MDPAREHLYETFQRLGAGVTVMKAFGGGDLLSEELSPAGKALTVAQCLHYALTRPAVACVMAGARSVAELRGLREAVPLPRADHGAYAPGPGDLWPVTGGGRPLCPLGGRPVPCLNPVPPAPHKAWPRQKFLPGPGLMGRSFCPRASPLSGEGPPTGCGGCRISHGACPCRSSALPYGPAPSCRCGGPHSGRGY